MPNSHRSNEATTILSKTTVGRSAVEQEDLKPNWKQKKGNVFSGVINNPNIYKFFKDLPSTEIRPTGQ